MLKNVSTRSLVIALLLLAFVTFWLFSKKYNSSLYFDNTDDAVPEGLTGKVEFNIYSDVNELTIIENNENLSNKLIKDAISLNNFYLFSLNEKVDVDSLSIFLTDKIQEHQQVYYSDQETVANSVGEYWDGENNHLDLYIHLSRELIESGNIEAINKSFNEYLVMIFYIRTNFNSINMDYIKDYYAQMEKDGYMFLLWDK